MESRPEPVALVPLLWSDKKFPYGDMRNRTIDSPAGRYAVAALAATAKVIQPSLIDFLR